MHRVQTRYWLDSNTPCVKNKIFNDGWTKLIHFEILNKSVFSFLFLFNTENCAVRNARFLISENSVWPLFRGTFFTMTKNKKRLLKAPKCFVLMICIKNMLFLDPGIQTRNLTTNMCQAIRNLCVNGRCIPLPGGNYRCECNMGFKLDIRGECIGMCLTK